MGHSYNSDGDFVRLVDGAQENEGRVEIYHHNEWRSVCGVGWNIIAANIVCRELGFLSATNAVQGSRFGSGLEPVWLSNIHCNGDEKSLTLCAHGNWGIDDCPDGSRAGIMSCGLVTARMHFHFIVVRENSEVVMLVQLQFM